MCGDSEKRGHVRAELPGAAFQGPLNSSCSDEEWFGTCSSVKLGYTNTEWNILISLVMPCTPGFFSMSL